METRRQERVRFPGAFGDRLAAKVERPAHEPRAYVLFAHCFSCSKDLKAAAWIGRSLVARGFGVMRFDFTGRGESEGDFADTNFSSNLDDLVAAADYMRAEYRAPQILIGHSLGGAAVLAAAQRIPESVAVATIGAPSDTAYLGEKLIRAAPDIEKRGVAELDVGGGPFRIKRQFVDDLRRQELTKSIARLDRALLVMHSPVDEIVPVDHARRIYDAARHPKSIVALDGADHLLVRRREDARYVAEILAAWADRYIEAGRPTASATPLGAQPREVVVRGGASGLAQDVAVGSHRLRADEPTTVGGTGTGPTPYGLLLAALGSCTTMTLRLYADRKEWPLEGIEARLRHHRIHAEDCEDRGSGERRIQVIDVELGLEGDLDAGQRERLMQIAERCPVHRTLTSELEIRTREAAPPERG